MRIAIAVPVAPSETSFEQKFRVTSWWDVAQGQCQTTKVTGSFGSFKEQKVGAYAETDTLKWEGGIGDFGFCVGKGGETIQKLNVVPTQCGAGERWVVFKSMGLGASSDPGTVSFFYFSEGGEKVR